MLDGQAVRREDNAPRMWPKQRCHARRRSHGRCQQTEKEMV